MSLFLKDKEVFTMGSEPIAVLCAANLTNASAFSLPAIFECAGTHSRSTLFTFASLSIVSQRSSANADVKVAAESAFRAASLSEHKVASLLINYKIHNLYERT